jgi:Domain of unknown function (DUF1876)
VISHWITATIADKNATVTAVYGSVNDRKYAVTGSAKRAKKDPCNPEIGIALAQARALRNLAAALEADAVTAVQAAMRDKQAAAARRIRRIERRDLNQPGRRAVFSVREIEEKYGRDAAKRAAARRAPRLPFAVREDGLDA